MTRVEAQKTMRNNINSIAQLVPLIVGQREREREREREERRKRRREEREREMKVDLDLSIRSRPRSSCRWIFA